MPRGKGNAVASREQVTATSADARRQQLTDPVDWASHYWQEQNLGDHEEAFLAMSSALRFHRIMNEAVEGRLKGFGLNMTDYLLLMTLQLSENGTRLLSRLAWNLLVHATTVTLATDRLEAKGLLYRHAHPTDRRATCVTITEEGQELTLDATDALKSIRFGLSGSTATEQKSLLAILASLRAGAGDIDRAH